MNIKSIILTCFLFLFSCQKGIPIEFFREDITIEVQNSKVRVTGIYFFKNLTVNRKRVTFYYPFPVDSNHLYPDKIEIIHPYEKDSTGIFFTLLLDAMKSDSFKIAYEQQVHHNRFKYITTTTKEWQRSIKEAYFTIIMPDSLSAKINYEPYESVKIDSKDYFYILQKDFYPDEDLIIEWFSN